MDRLSVLATIATILWVPLPAQAQVVSFNGTTIGSPLWNRPIQGSPPTMLHGAGPVFSYSAQPFFVNSPGLYAFQCTGFAPPAWDNYTFLYSQSFDPGSPLTNVLIGNDDNPTEGLSGFSFDLTAGTQYFFVTTGFNVNHQGFFSVGVTPPTGSGGVFLGAVPEPTSFALSGIAIAGIACF